MSFGGGGGQSGGAVVQTTSPWAAMAAGQIGANAAREAADINKQYMTDALNSINRQYSQARYDLSPTRTVGIQALDQLNQYLGLDPWNPGVAPAAPTNPADWNPGLREKKQYIADNTNPYSNVAPGDPQSFGRGGMGYDVYTGAGARWDGWSRNAPGGPASGVDIIGLGGNANFNSLRPDQQAAAIAEMKQQYMQDNAEAYKIAQQNYNQDLGEYNQNLDWYNQYKAAGPLTSQQVTDKITNLPGYQAQLGQGQAAIGANASSKGYLGSGRILKELASFGQNTLSQFYGDELSRLAGLVQQGADSAKTTSANSQSQGNSLASLYQSLGSDQAGAKLAAGNAQSQALIAANQQFNTIGGNSGGDQSGIGSLLGQLGSAAINKFL